MLDDLMRAAPIAEFIAWTEAELSHGYGLLVNFSLTWAEVFMSIGAAYAARMIPLRYMSMFSNMFGLAQGVLTGSLPGIVEHGVNLPLNAARAREMRRLIAAVREASKTDLNIEWLKPFAHPRAMKAGATLFRKGEEASEAFILIEGRVDIPELGVSLHQGDIFGEMALFSTEGRRMASAVCATDVRLLFITYEEFEQHYFQNPEFGLYLVRLIVRRLDMNYQQALGARASSSGLDEQSPGVNQGAATPAPAGEG